MVDGQPGHGWWYHPVLHPIGLDFHAATVTTKTTTLLARAGNMPLEDDGLTPKEWMPACIIVNHGEKAVLNAVSLSGPGLEALLQKNIWQRCASPLIISVMSLARNPADRKAELSEIFRMIASAYHKAVKQGLRPQWVIQINFSCPNGGLDPNDLVAEVLPILEVSYELLPREIPTMPKFGPEIHPESVVAISKAKGCNAICVFNTMPFGKHPKWARDIPPIDWKKIFGTDDPKESPMAKRFPGFAGGYSGKELLPFLLAWLPMVRNLGVQTPICAGGGILSPDDTARVFSAGANGASLGSIAMLAPTQVRRTIRAAYRNASLFAQNTARYVIRNS